MVNTCSNRVIKYIMFGFNFIFVITGIIILAVGASVKAYYTPYDTFLDDRYFSLPNMLIATGSLIFFISFLGCYGAMRENWFLLMIFSVLLTIIFIFELSVGIAGYVLRDKTAHYVESTLSGSMPNYEKAYLTAVMWDTIQTDFQCCGVYSYDDWKLPLNGSNLPVSCCPQYNGIVGAFYCNSYTHDSTTVAPATTEPATTEPATTEAATTVPSGPAASESTEVPTTIQSDPSTTEVAISETTTSTSESSATPPNNPAISINGETLNSSYPTSSSKPYASGCLSLFGNFVKQHAVDIGAVGISLAVIQLVGICLSFYMARQLKNGYYST